MPLKRFLQFVFTTFLLLGRPPITVATPDISTFFNIVPFNIPEKIDYCLRSQGGGNSIFVLECHKKLDSLQPNELPFDYYAYVNGAPTPLMVNIPEDPVYQQEGYLKLIGVQSDKASFLRQYSHSYKQGEEAIRFDYQLVTINLISKEISVKKLDYELADLLQFVLDHTYEEVVVDPGNGDYIVFPRLLGFPDGEKFLFNAFRISLDGTIRTIQLNNVLNGKRAIFERKTTQYTPDGAFIVVVSGSFSSTPRAGPHPFLLKFKGDSIERINLKGLKMNYLALTHVSTDGKKIYGVAYKNSYDTYLVEITGNAVRYLGVGTKPAPPGQIKGCSAAGPNYDDGSFLAGCSSETSNGKSTSLGKGFLNPKTSKFSSYDASFLKLLHTNKFYYSPNITNEPGCYPLTIRYNLKFTDLRRVLLIPKGCPSFVPVN